jgi:hypothetical protein
MNKIFKFLLGCLVKKFKKISKPMLKLSFYIVACTLLTQSGFSVFDTNTTGTYTNHGANISSGEYVKFDGSNDYIQLSENPLKNIGTGDFEISLDIVLNSLSNDLNLIQLVEMVQVMMTELVYYMILI